jgi:hypothetical protein
MSILETDKIDIVGTRPGTNVVRLVVADHLGWDDVERHSKLLQEKINTYIAFVESGQLGNLQEPTIPPSPDVVIALALTAVPSDEAKVFLAETERFLRGIGLGFVVEVHPPSE